MMICEKCGNELLNGSVICRHCSHNQVLERIDAWRDRRSRRALDAAGVDTPITTPEDSVATSVAASGAADGALIRFPNPQGYMAEDSVLPENSSDLPLWKRRLNQRLQEIRENKSGEPDTREVGSKAQARGDIRDPRVESALNRIRRADYMNQVPPITPTQGRRSPLAKKVAAVEEPRPLSIDERRIQALSTPVSRAAGRSLPVQKHAESFESKASVVELSPEMPAFDQDGQISAEVTSNHSGSGEVFNGETTESEPGMVLEAASLRMRLAAAVIDAEVIALSFLPLFAVFAFFGGKFQFSATMVYIMASIAVCLMTVYFFLTYTLAGRTIGMGLVKLHLASQSPLDDHVASDVPSTVTFTIGQAFARTIGGVITLLFFPINIVFLTRSYDRLSISDYLSNTQIVRIRK